MECLEQSKIRKVQDKHLEILQYIDNFCSENNIEYCLAYGSALGAMRHGGPIPWDDDADIYMTAEGYDKFRRLFHEKGDTHKYYLQQMQCVDGMLGFGKLRMNGTTFVEEIYKDWDIHHGIYVDIFLLHDAPPTFIEKKKSIFSACYKIIKEMANTNYEKRKIVKPITLFLNLFSKRFGMGAAYRQMYKWDSTGQDYYADWEKYVGTSKWFMEKSQIFPAKRVPYDGTELFVPARCEEYLEQCYGNWRQPPTESEISWHQHALIIDTEKDFHEYLPTVKDYRDEII